MDRKKFREYTALVTVVFFGLLILYSIYRFINGFFGALLFYLVLNPVHKFLMKHKVKRKISAIIVVLLAVFAIFLPTLAVIGIIGNEMYSIAKDPATVNEIGTVIHNLGEQVLPSVDQTVLNEQLQKLGTASVTLFFGVFSNIGSFLINIFITFFLLYYMLIHGPIFKKVEEIVPFSRKNSNELTNKMRAIANSTVLVGGIIALVQGGLLTISFLVFGIQGAFLWGFITAILSFLPVIGPPVIWIPASIIQFAQGDKWAGIGLIIFGLFLSNVDNFIRPWLGNAISKVHPLETFIGVFVGVALFGIIGIFVGPLLLSVAFLVFRMYRDEYVKG